MEFNKPALSIDDQVQLLLDRGMIIRNLDVAKHALAHTNYYRLRAYWLPFECRDNANNSTHFRKEVNFEEILAVYHFDRQLRLILLDAIERFEISLRTSFAYILAMQYGPFAHENSQYFHQEDRWKKSLVDLENEYGRSHETFAQHFREQYPKLTTPPIWASIELMTLGHLSRWLRNIKEPNVRQLIADRYNLDEKVLISFVHHLSIIRNHCAHHGRIWNRRLTVKMQIPGKKPRGLSAMFNEQTQSYLYNTLTMLLYLMGEITPNSFWRKNLINLLDNFPQINLESMGFPKDWRQRQIWNGSVS